MNKWAERGPEDYRRGYDQGNELTQVRSAVDELQGSLGKSMQVYIVRAMLRSKAVFNFFLLCFPSFALRVVHLLRHVCVGYYSDPRPGHVWPDEGDDDKGPPGPRGSHGRAYQDFARSATSGAAQRKRRAESRRRWFGGGYGPDPLAPLAEVDARGAKRVAIFYFN